MDDISLLHETHAADFELSSILVFGDSISRLKKHTLLAIPNTESNSSYIRYCKEKGLSPHPARFPSELPEYFIRMLTDKGDFVFEPFWGSCITGEVCERLKRKWVCCELVEEYLKGAIGRFECVAPAFEYEANSYNISKPGALWHDNTTDQLPKDGGKQRTK